MIFRFLRKAQVQSLFALMLMLAFVSQAAAQQPAPARSDSSSSAALSQTEKDLTASIKIQTIKEITAALAAGEMQGRGTMQPGGDKAASWIADRFQKLGLKPLGTEKGSYLQKIDFRETALAPESALKIGAENLRSGSDFAFVPMPYEAADKSAAAEMVFVAYGIDGGFSRKDLTGVDVRGKIVVLIDGPPANVTGSEWEKQDGKIKVLVGLIRSGAAGVIFIPHGREKEPVETFIDYLGRRQISMADKKTEAEPIPIPPLVMASGKAAEKLFAKSGVSLKDALAQAETGSFRPFSLNQEAKIVVKYKTTRGFSSNVAGYIEGSDPKLKEEAVLFSAHYDAYGMENGKIYHGAADNALGVAEMMAVAEAYTKLPTKPKRSMIFLAVTGEEYGLYGSKYWAKNPTWNIKKVAANLNLDGIGTEVYAPVKTFVGFGAEHSTIGALLTDVSSAFGIRVIPDPMPDEKIFYRSDHYSFVERGVPALMLLGAPAGDPQAWIKRSKEWEKTDYHQPTDTIRPDWSWEGAKTVADVMAILGWRISQTEAMPRWLPSSRFANLERGNTKEISEDDN
ncbi:MAG TPA: M28 family peptidase [Pyrinomonadaceae bacterium]|nr:M28 family peptidase [Pyrinomonadaceae bacterium]